MMGIPEKLLLTAAIPVTVSLVREARERVGRMHRQFY